MNPVPSSYLGVWQRTLLTTPNGLYDSRTRVYWLQTERLFADLRIPRPAPQTPEELAMQAGFAGVTEVNGERCQWHRAIDFQPPKGRLDIGCMHFERADYLIEDALDDSYHEVWERLPDSLGRNWGSWLNAADGRQGCLLLAGDYFLFAAGRSIELAPAESLAALLSNAAAPDELLAFELSFGSHGGGQEPWTIHYSTLPAQVGQHLLSSSLDPDQPDQLLAAETLCGLGAQPPAGGWQVCPPPLLAMYQECRQ
jgi:hypothetical protein